MINIYFMVVLLFNIIVPKSDTIRIVENNTKVDLIKIAAPPVQVYHAINKYAPIYGIPYNIAYGVARLETGFRGPTHISYCYRQTSYAGAEGAMQFMMPTIKWLTGDNSLTREEVRSNVKLNVKYSMKYLNMLYKRYGDYHIVLGYYNTGYPRTNSYALKII